MPKRARPVDKPEIILDQNAQAPLYRQLYERLRAQILAGQLETGARLPSTRVLASQLGVSRNTTALAYEQLLLEGYLESRVGDGTRVALLEPEQLAQAGGKVSKQSRKGTPATQHTLLARRGQILLDEFAAGHEVEVSPDKDMFLVGEPEVAYFPYEIWARLIAKHARQSLQAHSRYQDVQGYGPLREAIVAHIGITRGVHCMPEQIILTAGAQGALDLVARVLLDPGERAWVEDPGYFGARGALMAAGAVMLPVPVDRQGISVEVGRQLQGEARLAVVTPSHQFPTGVTMSLGRRLELLEWARETQGWIVEDDYDSEYRYSGRPLEALHGLDRAGRVIYIGTFSKVLFPSLRLGYMVVPPQLLEGFLATRRFVDVHLPLLGQMALADFITEGHFVRYLRKMRGLYMERRDALVNALNQELGNILDVTIPEAGIHLVAWLPEGVSADSVVELATKQGLRILPVSRFSMRPLKRDGLVLGFANATPEALRADVHALARVLRSALT
ncbi:GntR family transcriptional regulator [Ktedonobacter sp. SOSP1-52]|uniref:MocR-like pyridoxine biosynthesis transcription factor PdxR n=1 Tax=Ktedonobacter sp. SOSP1-52 TaxID=2778366 RepID=UPI00191642C4|nr:PLP-dependent aminotransferase family protein [Ktedonobacter sp. SOSP1-52]GHO70253.1 GntR family transcriptional regulator [Ktedonobacter sp. SOSP1-52]